eukprot:140421-Prymnesium_polylepis.1
MAAPRRMRLVSEGASVAGEPGSLGASLVGRCLAIKRIFRVLRQISFSFFRRYGVDGASRLVDPAT